MSHKHHGRRRPRRPPVTSSSTPGHRVKTWASRYSGLPEDQDTTLDFAVASSPTRWSKISPYNGPHSPGSMPPPSQPSWLLSPRMKKSFAVSFLLMVLWFAGPLAYRAAYRALTTDINPKLSRAVTERFGESLRRAGVREVNPNGKWIDVPTTSDDVVVGPNGAVLSQSRREKSPHYMATIRVVPPAPLAGGHYGVAFHRELDGYSMPLTITVDPSGRASVYYEPKPASNFDEVNAHVERLINTAIAVADHENLQRDAAARRQADNKRSWRD